MDFREVIYEKVETKQFIYEKKQQQIKFYKKSLGKLISLRATKNIKMFYFTRSMPDWVSTQKVSYTTGGYLQTECFCCC